MKTRKYSDSIRHRAKIAKARAEARTRRPWNVDDAERDARRQERTR